MDIPVLIVGGGPVGLACSLFLSRYQIRHLLVEKHPGTSKHPKAMGLQTRSMEIFRGVGAADDLKARALAEDWLHSIFWCTSLFGEILREIPLLSPQDQEIAKLSPVHALHCPQTATEEVLLKHAAKSAFADLRFHHELTEFSQTDEAVTARILNRETGESFSVKAQYMIAADGSGGGTREKLGIERLGPPDMGHFANIYFRADVGDRLSDRKGIIYNCLSTEDYGSVVAIDGADHWLMHHHFLPGETVELYTPEYCKTLVAKISGIEEEAVTILGVSPWVMSAQVSKEFRSGRVFLTGDAAHRTTPAGGLGLNSGIHSAHNLACKIGAVLRGWCAASILDSYDEERRAVVVSNIDASKNNAGGIFSIVEAACSDRWDEAVQLIRQLPAVHNNMERDLGYRYTSGAFAFGGPETAVAPVAGRAPHRWLAEGKSTLDLFGDSFVYLFAEPEAASFGEKLRARAAKEAIQATAIPGEILEEAYGCESGGAVLVRPDGFIGWKSIQAPADQQIDEILTSLGILKT